MSGPSNTPAEKGKTNVPANKTPQPSTPAFGELTGLGAEQGELAPGVQLVPGTTQTDLPQHSSARGIRQQAAFQAQQQVGNAALQLAVQGTARAHSQPQPIQLQPAPAPAPAAGGSPARTMTSGNTFQHGSYTLSTDAVAMRKLIEDIATEKGIKGARQFVYGEFAATVSDLEAREGGSGASAGSSSGVSASTDDLETLRAIRTVLQTQFKDFETSSAQFLKDFEGSAHGVVWNMLQGSEEKLMKEAERYGLTGGFGSLNPFEVQTGAAVETENNKELAGAAGQMMALRQEADKAIGERSALFKPDDPFRLFVDKDKENALTTKINENEEKINQIVSQYPILAGYKDPEKKAQLATMSQGGGQAALTIGPMIKTQLENIKLVRGGLERGQLKIWNLPTVVKGAKGQMGLGPSTLGNKLVDDHAAEIQSDEMLVNLAIGAVTIALGILAAVPTGGAGGAAVMAGASAVSAGISTYQAVNALMDYQLAKAATATDPDKAKAISQEDPSLFWLALDIVGMIADVHGALAAFRAMAPQVRTVLSITEDFEKVEDGLKTFKEGCTNAKVPGLYDRVVSRIRSTLEKNKDTVDDLKKLAQQRYNSLSEAEKADLLKEGITEEKFVAQMGANAQRDIVISGAEGVRRTKMVSELMMPNNPQIAAVIAGDTKAMDALLKSHGNWQQLMSQLSAGTPEMKAAAQKMVERRAGILKDIEMKFFAKPAGGASTEAVSDVDLIAESKDAGSMMIQAEEYVKGFYGEGWSEILRMNFYTMADRLFMYAKEMKGLPAEMRAGLLKDLSKQTDMYNVAKMLEYAKGDKAALKRAEEYAKTLGVDINNPEIKKLLTISHSAKDRLNERNLLLIKADELMRKYNALPPNASPQERMALAREISENQMRANFFTEEAYIGPGAARMVVTGVDVVGFEAKMAVTSQLSMISHEIAKYGGKVELAMREYEIYKYINRFAAAARKAGSNHPGLNFYENMSGFLYKSERAGASTHAHIGGPGPAKAPKGAPVLSDQKQQIGEVTDDYLKKLYGDFNRFSHEIMKEMDMITSQAPTQWTPYNVPRPNSGPMKREP